MTLLMADDDRDDREMMAVAFEKECAGHNLEFVCDGEELVTCLKKKLANSGNLPDLILLDLNMPKIDGRRALKEIKETPGLKTIPVVVYSTSDSEEDKAHTLGLGAETYITKPFDFREMLRVCKLICVKYASAES